ncbi:MAG: YHS domain-containing protein [Armatimonadetes bacterium]|nr:YHS domain-containing protein [Armatimonadota bacterium]
MKVNKNSEPRGGKSTYKGVTYYFCNPNCKAEFDKDPEKHLGQESDEQ